MPNEESAISENMGLASPLEDDKSSSSPKERGTLVQRTCAWDDGKSDGSLRTSESSWRSTGRKPPNKVRSGGGDEGDGDRAQHISHALNGGFAADILQK